MTKAFSIWSFSVSKQQYMRVVFFFFIVFLSLTGTGCWIGGYSEEVYSSFAASPGYVMDDSVYFLVNYRLFRRPEGILRFPDGGISKTVIEKLYLMEYTEDRLLMVEKASDNRFASSVVKRTQGSLSETGLELVIKPLWKSEETLSFTVERNPAFTPSAGNGEVEKKSISFTSNLLRQYGPGAAGLPSPLDYTQKRRKSYIRDLKELNGDSFYRKEIIRRMELSDAEIENILKSIEKRSQRPETLEAMKYSLTGKDMIKELETKDD